MKNHDEIVKQHTKNIKGDEVFFETEYITDIFTELNTSGYIQVKLQDILLKRLIQVYEQGYDKGFSKGYEDGAATEHQKQTGDYR